MKNADEYNRDITSLDGAISQLLSHESNRYLSQAQTLLETGFLKVTCNSVLIEYKISGDQFCYRFKNRIDGALQESEILSPELSEDQIEALKFIFAQSEAEASL